MNGRIWILVTLVFSAALAVLFSEELGAYASDLVGIRLAAAIDDRAETLVAISATLAATLAGVSILGLLPVGIYEVIAGTSANKALAEAADQQESGTSGIYEGILRDALEQSDSLIACTDDFIAACTRAANTGKRAKFLEASHLPAADVFTHDILVEGALRAGLFRVLSNAGFGFALFAFLAVGARAVFSGSSAEITLASGAAAALPPLLAGLITIVLLGLIQSARQRQVDRTVRLVDRIFAFGRSSAKTTDALEATERHTAAAVSAITKFADTIHNDLEKTLKKMESELAQSVAKALAEPMEKLTTATRELAKDQRTAVKMLVDETFEGFVERIGSISNDQAAKLGQTLEGAAKAAQSLEASLKAEQKAFVKQLGAQSRSQSKAFDRAVKSLSAQENRAISGITKEIQTLVKSTQSEFATHAGAVADELKGVAKEIAATDEKRAKTLKAETSSAMNAVKEAEIAFGRYANEIASAIKEIEKGGGGLAKIDQHADQFGETAAKAGDDLKQASAASLEIVGQFVTLAEALSEASTVLRGVIEDAGRLVTSSTAASEREQKLGRALRDLKDQTSGAFESLPEI